MIKELTIFSVDLFDNNYAELPLHKFCINSWQRLVDYLAGIGIKASIKIYNSLDEDVIFFKKDCEKHFSVKQSKPIIADAFRMYILSKYPNHLWLDLDVFVFDPSKVFTFDWDEKLIYPAFWTIYNGPDLDFFKNLYSTYKNGDNIKKLDVDVSKNFQTSITRIDGLMHLYFLGNMRSYGRIFEVEDISKLNDFFWNNCSNKREFIFIIKNLSPKASYVPMLRNLRNIDEIINYIFTNYKVEKLPIKNI